MSPRDRRALRLGAAFGLVLGAVEALLVVSTHHTPGSFLSGIVLAAIASSIPGLAALALSWLLLPLARRGENWEADAAGLHIGVVACAIGGLYGLIGALDLWQDERWLAAVPVALLPLVGGVAIGLWTRFLYEQSFPKPRDGALRWGLGLTLALGVATGAVQSARSNRRPEPKEAPSVVLITLDTFRRDAMGAYGDGPSATPRLDQLASEGILFLDAVTPMPETAPSHASMLTGLHPLRHHVLSNGHHLSTAHETLPQVLAGEGWATGAFGSSFAVDARTGLDRGFQSYDDALAPAPPGLVHLRPVHLLTRAWMILGDPARTPWLLERDGDVTVDRFEGWLDDTPGAFFAWVHLFETHAPYEPRRPGDPTFDHRAHMGQTAFSEAELADLQALYRSEVEDTDRLVGRVLDALSASGRADRTLVIVVADHGEMLGEHGIAATHHGLAEEVVRVPLVIRVPQSTPDISRVEAEVRVLDLPATIYEYLGVEGAQTEGVPLLDYANGRRSRDLGVTLVGRRARSFADGALIGVRATGTKYVRDLVTGSETLFLVDDDPGEADDRVAWYRDTSPESLERVRMHVDPEAKAFEELLRDEIPDLPLADAHMLEQMGYQR